MIHHHGRHALPAGRTRAMLPSAHAQCDHCGAWQRRAWLAQCAADLRDLRNGRLALCGTCQALWAEARADAIAWASGPAARPPGPYLAMGAARTNPAGAL